MPPLHKHTHKRNPFHIQKERWWGPSIYSSLPSMGLQMQQEIGLHMWPQLMLWDALTDWSESSPLSDSGVYALRFQHTDSIAFLSHCAYMGKSGQYWFGECMRSMGDLWDSVGSLYTNTHFQWLPPTIKCPDDQIHLQDWIQWFIDSWIWLENDWLCFCENKDASQFVYLCSIWYYFAV